MDIKIKYHQLTDLILYLKKYGNNLNDPVIVNIMKSISVIASQVNNKAIEDLKKQYIKPKFYLISVHSKLNF